MLSARTVSAWVAAVVDEHTGKTRVADGVELDIDTLRALHHCIVGVSEDFAALRNNTATAGVIEYANHLTKAS